MGYYTTSHGIKNFTPDDTDNEFYITSDASLSDIMKRCQEKWGENVAWDNITIHSEYIQCYCLGYGRYDPGDYENYLKVEYTPT